MRVRPLGFRRGRLLDGPHGAGSGSVVFGHEARRVTRTALFVRRHRALVGSRAFAGRSAFVRCAFFARAAFAAVAPVAVARTALAALFAFDTVTLHRGFRTHAFERLLRGCGDVLRALLALAAFAVAVSASFTAAFPVAVTAAAAIAPAFAALTALTT